MLLISLDRKVCLSEPKLNSVNLAAKAVVLKNKVQTFCKLPRHCCRRSHTAEMCNSMKMRNEIPGVEVIEVFEVLLQFSGTSLKSFFYMRLKVEKSSHSSSYSNK